MVLEPWRVLLYEKSGHNSGGISNAQVLDTLSIDKGRNCHSRSCYSRTGVTPYSLGALSKRAIVS